MRLGSFQLPNDASLSYAEYGTSTGKPVLLLHGLVGSICSEGMEDVYKRQMNPSTYNMMVDRIYQQYPSSDLMARLIRAEDIIMIP